MKTAKSLSLILFLVSSAAAWQARPRLCSLDAARLRQTKSRLTAAALRPAVEALRSDADNALKAGPFSVTQKERLAPSGDKHDYLSLAPYWWPDPKSKDGLPYIRRDGETNPDSKRGTDAPLIGAMAGAVETLAIAYYLTGEERYAERAALLIRTWFLDPATKMNPNFRYAQAVPGHNDGRAAGLIESRHFIKIVDASGLLGGSRAWTDKDAQALTAWFREFVNWMQTSSNGKDEARAKNNHGSWYAAQLACFALFIGAKELARATAEAARARIAWQVEPDGKQPQELQRTRAMGYSAFNLVALMTLAEAGKRAGVDLYGYRTMDGRGIRRALDYLAPYADATRGWPHQQINEMENARRDLAYLLRRASIAFREMKYEELLEKHLANEAARQRWQLLWPR
ncbi:MAG: alginate lyase family protein [Blastocatellia bacterium]